MTPFTKKSKEVTQVKAKFNVVDAVIILLILAVGAAGFLFLSSRSQTASTDKSVKIFYDVEIAEREEYLIDRFNEGEKVSIGEKEKIPATIVKKEVRPATKSSFDEVSGKFIETEVPGRYDIIVTLMSEGTDGVGAVSSNGTAIRVGMSAVVKGRDCAGSGYITQMYTEE